MHSPRFRFFLVFTIVAVTCLLAMAETPQTPPSVVRVTSQGFSDPNFYKDKTIAYDEAVRDSKRQAIEKVMGCYISSESIVQNYNLVRDRVISKSEGFIKRLIEIRNQGIQDDGFYHVELEADVATQPLTEALADLTRSERQIMLMENSNPTIEVDIDLLFEGKPDPQQKCTVCKNEISDVLKKFGYTVVSPAVQLERLAQRYVATQGLDKSLATRFLRPGADIFVSGQVRLTRSPTVMIAGTPVSTILLTAWSLDAIDTHTGEVILSKSFQPSRGQPFNNEADAILGSAQALGRVFAENIFKDFVLQPSHRVLVVFTGIGDRDTAQHLKKELLGLRSVLNVAFQQFLANQDSVYEVEFAGNREGLGDILSKILLPAFNRRYGTNMFSISEEHGNLLRIRVSAAGAASIAKKAKTSMPIQLTEAQVQPHLSDWIKSPALKKRYLTTN